MYWHVPEDAMPWVGLYCAVASSICTLAMTADVANGFWQWKLRFPNKIFTLNATTITLNAIAMKLPVDLTSNFLPSLGLMDDKELLTNIVALGILIKMRCHHHAIEKRGDNIRSAAQLLGKSKKILKILKARQPFNIDQDSMAYIDKWHAILKSQTPIGSLTTTNDASSTRIEGGSSNSNELVIVTRKGATTFEVQLSFLANPKKILKILKARQPFSIEQDSMAYIDKWRAILKSQTPIGSLTTTNDASSTRIQGGSSNSNELVIVTIL
ncbi:hypothetical protein E3N88_33143 [Mikania micrantha]|uniref:Uncharacterized protein n=1 Tax=Mikania micrantha TaxID=192012 RepID=A0A5N6MB52_9ASTR|nr:hypothetical protein E3N88_33143 [Mikania micrantha]